MEKLINENTIFEWVDNPVDLKFPEIIPTDPPIREVLTPKIVEKQLNRLEEVFNALELIKDIFPRIYERIEACWGSNELDTYLEKLIVDDRGNRAGFPKPILEALLIISKANLSELIRESKVIDKHKNNPWITFSYK